MDERLRAIERRGSTGDPEDEARLLCERLRAGAVRPCDLIPRALEGEPVARLVLGDAVRLPSRAEAVRRLRAWRVRFADHVPPWTKPWHGPCLQRPAHLADWAFVARKGEALELGARAITAAPSTWLAWPHADAVEALELAIALPADVLAELPAGTLVFPPDAAWTFVRPIRSCGKPVYLEAPEA